MTETPSELLTRAADLIRDRAADASKGAFSAGHAHEDGRFYGQYGDYGWYVTGYAGTPEFEDSEQGLADARWVALLNPSVAPALEATLREAASAYDSAADGSVAVEDNWLALTALEVARAVLGLVDTPVEDR